MCCSKSKTSTATRPIYITENGCAAFDEADANGFVDDRERVNYLRRHLIAVHDAIEAGVNLKGLFCLEFDG